jgi:hypothetical protein
LAVPPRSPAGPLDELENVIQTPDSMTYRRRLAAVEEVTKHASARGERNLAYLTDT